VVVATDLHGYPVDVAGIRKVLPDVIVIEDASQAIGATRAGTPAGATAHLAVWSIGRGKIVDAGEGGIVTTDDGELRDALDWCVRHPSLPTRRLCSNLARGAVGRLHALAATLAAYDLSDVDARSATRRASGVSLAAVARAEGCDVPQPESGVSPTWERVVALATSPRRLARVSIEERAYTPSRAPLPMANRWARRGRVVRFATPEPAAASLESRSHCDLSGS
jgi:dTDP-4-amino-4,6-dideoxygalactose transaminase